MKHLKKYLVLALVLALLLPSAALAGKLEDIKASGELKVGTSINFPPFEFWYTNPETGEQTLEGFEMKFAQGLADELGVKFVPVDQAFSGLITELRASSIDCIASGMVMKPDRLEVAYFSTPYYTGSQVMVVHKDNLEKYKTVDDINGQQLGVQMGALQVEIAAEQFPKSDAMQMDSIPMLVMELRMGNIEGLILADSVAGSYATVYPEIAISEVPVVDSPAGVGMAINKTEENKEFLDFINAYVDKVLSDGTFDKWVAESFEVNGLLLQQEQK